MTGPKYKTMGRYFLPQVLVLFRQMFHHSQQVSAQLVITKTDHADAQVFVFTFFCVAIKERATSSSDEVHPVPANQSSQVGILQHLRTIEEQNAVGMMSFFGTVRQRQYVATSASQLVTAPMSLMSVQVFTRPLVNIHLRIH
ncbi:hypothetical protein [Glaciimonas sp. PCH181]|uniref:hypothetical protein n=1 Tax=Glaciimonas sp. PCH181 TaxID=2133943 RepID=UPI002102C6A6|nr:hypothetical protein [Glaciimonas sp. PCH181]